MPMRIQDTILMHRQEHLMRRHNLSDKSYTLFSPQADAGVVAVNR